MIFVIIFFVALLVAFAAWLITIWMRMNQGFWNKKALMISGIVSAAGLIIAIVCLVFALT